MADSRNKYPKYRPKKKTESQAHKAAVMAEYFAKQNLRKSEIVEKLLELDKEINKLKSRIEAATEPFSEGSEHSKLHMQVDNERQPMVYLQKSISELKAQEESVWGNFFPICAFIGWGLGGLTVLYAYFDSLYGSEPPANFAWWYIALLCVTATIAVFSVMPFRKASKIKKRISELEPQEIEQRQKYSTLWKKLQKHISNCEDGRQRYKNELKEKMVPRKAWRQVQTQIEEEERDERRKANRERIKAQSDAYRDDIREQSETIKRKLKVTEECPYCDGPLGEDFHADHIYPVNRGGLSTTDNMVNVCSKCNLAKGALTLRQFCEETGLKQNELEKRLDMLGKVY